MAKENLYQNYWNEKVSSEGDYPEYNPAGGGQHHISKSIKIITQHLPRNAKALDVGCGTGLTTSSYSIFCRELWAIDYAQEAIKKARELYPQINFVDGDITAMPFNDGEFDVIICSGVLHHLIKPMAGEKSVKHVYNAIKEIDRVSKGLILIDEANGLNPIRKWKEKTYYKKINRNEESYSLRIWKKIFREFGYEVTYHRYHTFIPVNFPQKLMRYIMPIEKACESIPFIKNFGGGVFFKCQKIRK